MLKMYLDTKYFLQMYLNNNYIDVFKYFLNTFVNTFFYIIFKISSLFICCIINLKMNKILDIKLVQYIYWTDIYIYIFNKYIEQYWKIYGRYPVAQIGDCSRC